MRELSLKNISGGLKSGARHQAVVQCQGQARASRTCKHVHYGCPRQKNKLISLSPMETYQILN